MSYVLYDSRGYVADVASNRGMATIRSALARVDALKPLAEEGTIDMTPEARQALNSVRGDESVQNFVRNARRCRDVCIISDGTDDESEDDDDEADKGGPGSGHHGHAGIPGHRGGSMPTTGTSVAKRNRLKREKIIRAYAGEHASDRLEHGLILDEEGNVISEKMGTRNSVRYSGEECAEIIVKSNGKGSSIHNHPSGDNSLSPADMSFAARQQIGEEIASTERYLHIMRILPQTNISGLTNERATNRQWRKYRDEIMPRYRANIFNGDMTATEAWGECTHEIAGRMATRYNFEYERLTR